MALTDSREKIDAIDLQLTQLLAQRLAISKEIAQVKVAEHIPLTNKEREQEVYARVTQDATPEVQPYLRTLFEDIILVSKQYQAHQIQLINDQENPK